MAADPGSSSKAILYAFLANLGIAVTKSGAAFYTNSGSMLAEAIHSYADCANQVLLFTMGGLFSIYEGWHKLREPDQLNQAWIALSVLGIAVLLESASLMGCLREIAKVRRGRSFRDWLKHTRNAELVVILGEDVAALAGLVLAFTFVSLAAATGDTRFDAAGSIAIGTVLIFVAIFIAVRVRTLLIGKSAEPALERQIVDLINRDRDIEELLNTITLQFGPKVVLAAKVKMRAGLTIEEAVDHLNALERDIKKAFPEVGWIFVEPDITD